MNMLFILLTLFYLGQISSMPDMMPVEQSAAVDAAAQSVPDQTTGVQPATPEAAPEAMPMATPAADATPQQMSSATPAEPEPTYDQLKWPDSIELEEGKDEIEKSDDPKVIEASKKVVEISNQMQDIAKSIKETADKANQEFTRIDNILDDFFQNIGFEEGKVLGILKSEK
jgi:flagellar biosynthesis component FlhA